MIIYRAFDEIFRSWSHVAVLRTLMDTTSGFTGNEVARLSGMHPLTALKALTSLEQLGIVHRLRGGRDHIFTLNRKHALVRDAILQVYDSEGRFFGMINGALATTLKRSVISAVIYGSVARQKETPSSDLDLCCIVKTENQKENVRKLLYAAAPGLYLIYGVKVAPLLFTIAELKKKSNTPLIRDIIEHGRTIVGKIPGTLVNG